MVWYSNSKSLKDNEISFLAIIEIFIAMGLFWFIAIHFNIYIHLFLSILIAPLLLLNSDKSKKYNIQFLNYLKNISKKDIRPEHRGYAIQITIISSFILTVTLLKIQVNFLIIIFIISTLATCILLFFGREMERIEILGKIYISMTLGLSLGFLIMGQWYGLICSFFLFYINFLLKEQAYIFFAIMLLNPLTLNISTVLLMYLYSLFSIIKSKPSLSIIATNWKFNVLINDFKNYPELILGAEDANIEIIKFSNYIKNKNISIIFLFPLFLFPIIYRLSMKATFWFYIPLLILVKTPQNLNNTIEIKNFLSKLHRYIYVKFLFWMALIMLYIFLLTKLNPTFLEDLNNPFSMYMIIIYFDFSSIEVWKLLQLLLAVFTIVLYFWSDIIWKKNENRGMSFIYNKHIKYIFLINNIKNVVAFFYFLFLLLYISYKFEIWNYKYIPNSIEPFLLNMMKIIQYKLF